MRPSDPRLRARLAVARRPLTGLLAAGAAASLVTVLQAFAVAALVVAVVSGDGWTVPAALVVASLLARAATQGLADLAAGRAARAVTTDLRRRVMRATVAGRTASMSEGELAALATRGVQAAEPYLVRYLPAVVLAAVLPPLTVVAIATQDLLSAVIVVATLPLVPVFGALVGLATRDRAEAQWRAMASLSGHFVDVMRGLPTLVAYRRARHQSGTIRAITDRYRRSTMGTLRLAFASSAVLELVATLSVALVAVVVGVRLAAGDLDLRTGLVVLLLAPEAYWPLRRMGAEFHAAAEGVSTFERLAELDVDEPADQGTSPEPHRMLVARGLTYRYPGRNGDAVEDLDLTCAPASLTVLRGPSGSGKSTVLALLAGLLEPSAGSVRAGDADCASASWRSQVAWIPQRPAFLPGTVADNLRVGAPTASDEELWSVLRRVALAERVAVAGGLDATVGEDGKLFSAGERARLALARAVVSARPWILLDEPTAHLDPITRQVLLDVIVEESRTRGVVVVAHDPATIAAADRVITVRPPDQHAEPVDAGAPGPAPEPEPEPERAADQTSAKPAGSASFVLSTVLGSLSSLSGIALTATAGWLIVKAAEHPPVLTMLVAIVGVRTFGLARPVLRYAERLRSHDAALRKLAGRRVEVYDALVPLTPGRLGKRRGDVLASVVDDVDATLDRELRVRLPLRTAAAALVASTIVAMAVSIPAGAVVAAASACGAALAYAIVRLGCRDPEGDAVATRAELSAAVLDTAHMASELRMWQATDGVLATTDRLDARLAAFAARSVRSAALARAVLHLATAGGIVGAAAVLAPAVRAGDVSGPFAALLLLLPLALADVIAGVIDAGAVVDRVRGAEARLDAYARTPAAVTDPPHPALPPGGGTALRADRVTLGWVSRPVLEGLDLTLRPGERVAVVGPSGSGKSTLAATLVRFIDPLAGTVALGGVGLATMALDDVRERVGVVDDDPHVFRSTVAENVRFARPGATDHEVAAALRGAHLGDWLDALPHGLATLVGDGAASLSGGERARLGLARALLADQPVLVLDEPVAHLDGPTAELVAADLVDAAAGRTIVWISHSPVGLDRMDRIVDLGAPVREKLRP